MLAGQHLGVLRTVAWLCGAIYLKMDCVDIRLSQSTSFNADKPGLAQFANVLGDAGPTHPHVIREAILAGKTGIVVPSVAQEHRVSQFGPDRQIRVSQDEIWHLGKTATRDWIQRVQLDVVLAHDFTNRFHMV